MGCRDSEGGGRRGGGGDAGMGTGLREVWGLGCGQQEASMIILSTMYICRDDTHAGTSVFDTNS